ncbi:MAG: hypothetical protein U0228_06835 [Myxococcaceae bacterium]
MRVSTWLLAAVVCTGCPSIDNPLLGDGGAGGGATGGGTTGGGAGTGGGSATGGGATGGGATGGGATGSGTGGGGACVPSWRCTPWREADGGAVRTCLDENACGVTTGQPTEGPQAIPQLDAPYYRCVVQPILERSCGQLACHGTEQDRALKLFARGRLRRNETVPQVSTCPNNGPVNLQMEGSATVMCVGWSRLTAGEWSSNLLSARLQGVMLSNPDDSELLQQPLETSPFAHAGIKTWKTTSDPEYQALKAWLGGATASASCDGGAN